MIPFIVILTIGIIIVIISCFLVDKPKDDTFLVGKIETDGIKRTLENSIQEVSEEAILKTEDELSKLSNEKIIAVHEFSNQIIEKINHNHEEVVFLYNMLNEKENEIKNVLKKAEEVKNLVGEVKEDEIKVSTSMDDKSNYQYINTLDKASNNTSSIDNDFSLLDNDRSQLMDETDSVNEINEVYDDLGLNNNEKILKLYKDGKSIMEISKMLGLGQGEVKLVIDLFR